MQATLLWQWQNFQWLQEEPIELLQQNTSVWWNAFQKEVTQKHFAALKPEQTRKWSTVSLEVYVLPVAGLV